MQLRRKILVMAAMMLSIAALSNALQPTIYMADVRAAINLKEMVPTAFGDWREQPGVMTQIVNPEQEETLQKIYSETLTRTYINSSGYRIMLSIAYGKNQKKGLELHKPEVCYPAQGFTVVSKAAAPLDLLGNPISSTKLVTTLGARHEPVTYWTVVGDQVTTGSLSKRWVETHYGLQNLIPDGMLVRVSSIDKNTDGAFAIQSKFSSELVGAISPTVRSRFAGL